MSKPSLSERQAGLLLHPSALPGPHGLGDVGPEARRLIDWLATAGLKLWQILPLAPPGDRQGCNPYVSWSALAGNPLLLSLDDLARDGLLGADDLAAPPFPADHIAFAQAHAFKAERVRRAARRLLSLPSHPLHAQLLRFRESAGWAEETALFAAIKAQQHGAPWWEWPGPLRRCEPAALEQAARETADERAAVAAEQLLFERQWQALRAYAAERGVRILGDLAIYVVPDSCDVWRHQEQFQLRPDGTLAAVAGCPPDVFAAEGQYWSNPLYDWDRMAEDDYTWWRARLSRAFEHADFVRLDHVRAFSAYWAIPAGCPAKEGRWRAGPGLQFFEAVHQHLGPLELCAEDLGAIDDDVRDLLRLAGLPGMRILQFAFGEGADNLHLPHNHVPGCIAYPGNHDNDTAAGWWRTLPAHARTHAQHYLGRHGDDIAWDLIRAALSSVASVAVVQAQDVLGLGSEARINDPASYGRVPPEQWRNWGWRMLPGALTAQNAARLRLLASLYGRTLAR
jgi:4-alpha-glucanotransferase